MLLLQQKMVIKVQMTCDKDRKKAMTLASSQGIYMYDVYIINNHIYHITKYKINVT